jgi:nucleoside-diphosphate-sugar epimerase
MHILITGATGFLGRNLVKYLEQFDYELTLTDLPPDLFHTAVSWDKNWLIHHCDLRTEVDKLATLMRSVDVVVHLANVARITPSWQHYQEYYAVNITASQQLFELAQKNNVGKFIYISSSSVYGNNGSTPQRETDPLCPTNPYAVSKVAAELALQAQRQQGDTKLVIVRPFTMYGDFMDFGPNGLVISKFISAWQQGIPLCIDGSGQQRRDFLHASDAVVGLDLIINNSVDQDIFNLGSGTAVSVQQLADAVSSKQIKIPNRVGAVETTHADITKLRSIGFNPTVDVIAWLTNTIEELKLEKHIF